MLFYYYFVLFTFEIFRNFQNQNFLIGISFCFIAILTRYASAVALLPICMVVLFRILKKENYKLLLFSSIIIVVISIPHLLIRLQNSLQFLNHQWLRSWNIFNLFQSDFNVAEDETRNHFINLIYIVFQISHPIFLFFGIILSGFILLKRKFNFNRHQKSFWFQSCFMHCF